jgi:hypothetical protein
MEVSMWRAADRIMIAGAIILVTVVGYKESGLKESVRDLPPENRPA